MMSAMRSTIAIATRDGSCSTSVFRPDGDGPWPGVLFFMDGIGPRPALFAMGERLAQAGYVVLLPDLFYRAGSYETPPMSLFSDPVQRQFWLGPKVSTATIANVMSDTEALLAHLAARPDVRQPWVGATGYCMGGARALAAAGTFPERIAAAASYHGGNLATDAPDSPHLLAGRMKARVYVAGAVEDPSFPDAMKARLEAALTAAGVRHVVETYPARHGWVPGDTLAHDAACAERHWDTLLALLGETLG
jgi:carboxymethylenebutenolidase